MGAEATSPAAGSPGGPDKKIVYAVIAIAVVILAVVLVAKFGYGADVLNPSGGQMSLVHNLSYNIRPSVMPSRAPIQKLCPQGTTGCNGTCVNMSSDRLNCGSCGNYCAYGADFCSGGVCCNPQDKTCIGVVCGAGTACCSGRCVLTGS